jgi:hypothetical protein
MTLNHVRVRVFPSTIRGVGNGGRKEGYVDENMSGVSNKE